MKREDAEALRAREQNNDIPGYDSSGVLTPPVNDEDWRNSTNITTRKKKIKKRKKRKEISFELQRCYRCTQHECKTFG